MSYPVNATVQVKGGPMLADYSSLTVSQFMFTHHSFALVFTCEALGKSLGVKPELVPSRAHEQLSGKDVAISWTGREKSGGQTGTFKFNGVITHVGVQTASDLTNTYHISGHSPTFLLEDGVQNRAFVKHTLQDIFQRVLGVYPGDALKHDFKAQHKEPLPYVAQYHESNFEFLTRLAARHGEWFYFDGQTLRLGAGPQGGALRFQSDSRQSFNVSMDVLPSRTEAAHYAYRTHQPLAAAAKAPAGGHPFSQFAVAKSEALFTQPHRLHGDTHLATEPELKRALNTMAAKRAAALVSLEGRGETYSLIPGALLDMYDAAGAGYGQFRVLSVHHDVDGDGNYTNHFEGLPGALDVPPPHPAGSPPLAQPELAEVIDLDDPRHLGRVRVRFHWSVAKPADAETGWLRVSTPYSGDGKGQMFTPEVGSQVLIGYENGLAEFPVVLGNLFHPQNKQNAKYTRDHNQLKGLQTAGGNKLVFNDTPGAQTILISNSNNKDTAVLVSFKGDGSIDIKTNGPINLTAGKDITLQAGKNITLQADENIALIAKKRVSVEALEEDMALRAQKEMLLTAVSSDLTLEAAAKKAFVRAANNVEVTATGLVKLNGSDVKLNG